MEDCFHPNGHPFKIRSKKNDDVLIIAKANPMEIFERNGYGSEEKISTDDPPGYVDGLHIWTYDFDLSNLFYTFK